MYIYKNEHNRQLADDWLWDTIPNSDSSRAIAQAKEPKAHQRTKHILCRNHLIQKIIDRGDVDLQKIDGKENLPNPFTKAITVKEFDNYKSKMGIRYCTDWL